MQNFSSHRLSALSPSVTAVFGADHFLPDWWAPRQRTLHLTYKRAVPHPHYKDPICTTKQTKSTQVQQRGSSALLCLAEDAEGTRKLLCTERQLSAWAAWLAKPRGQCSASCTARAYLYAFIPNCIWVSSSKTARRKALLVYCHCVGTANGTQPSAKLKSGYVANQDKITFLLTNCVKLPSSTNLESLLVSGEFTSHIPWSI